MTKKEAIKILKSREEEIKADGYIGFATALNIAIKALEQNPILDKVKNELIQSIQNGIIKIESGNEELFHIIDKYKAESEVK